VKDAQQQHKGEHGLLQILEIDSGGKWVNVEKADCTLGELIRQNKELTQAELEALVNGLGIGVSTLHHMGILHLDLKPDNVFAVTKDGIRCWVVGDFNLAHRYLKDGHQLIEPVGTPGFMAPEVLETGSLMVTPQTDMYSLGATLMAASPILPESKKACVLLVGERDERGERGERSERSERGERGERGEER
jgi:serine/threonine protein kinase